MNPRRTPRIFVDSDKISKYLYCSICHQVFDNPTRMRCGHTYCYECMFGWRKMSKLCPQCKTKHIKWVIEKDLIASHQIDEFTTKCCFAGCNWNGLYSGLKKHQRFCVFRETKQFDEQLSGQQIIPLDEGEDNEVQEVQTQSKKGRKRVKKNQEGMPQIPNSENSNDSLGLEPLQPRRRSSSRHKSEAPRDQQNLPNFEDDSSGDEYLETNLKKLFKKGKLKFSVHANLQKMNCQEENQKENNEQKKENQISRKMREVSFEEDDEIEINSRNGNNRKQRSQCESIEEEKQDFFRLLDQKIQEPPNYYLFRRHQQEEQRKRKERAQKKTGWKVVHPSSSTSKAQDSDSSMQNPFEESITEKKKPIKKIKFKQYIVLDSSSDENPAEQVEMSKESGQMSENLYNQPNAKSTSDCTQNPDSNGESSKEKQVKEVKQQVRTGLRIQEECTHAYPGRQLMQDESVDY